MLFVYKYILFSALAAGALFFTSQAKSSLDDFDCSSFLKMPFVSKAEREILPLADYVKKHLKDIVVYSSPENKLPFRITSFSLNDRIQNVGSGTQLGSYTHPLVFKMIREENPRLLYLESYYGRVWFDPSKKLNIEIISAGTGQTLQDPKITEILSNEIRKGLQD